MEVANLNRSIDYNTTTLFRNLNHSREKIAYPQSSNRSNKNNININISINENKKNNYLKKIFGKNVIKSFHKKDKF